MERVEKPADFLVSRFSRLYPVYWVAATFTFLVVTVFGLPGREVSVGDAALNLLMFHEYIRVPHVDGVYWTLTVELTFYFWIFVLYLFKQLRRVELWFTPLILLSMMTSAGFIELPYRVGKLLFLQHVSLFVAGICFYKLYTSNRNKTTLAVLLLSLFATIVTFSFYDFLFFSFFYILFYLATTGKLKFLAGRGFVFFGTISYSLYLVHQNIGYVIMNKTHGWGIPYAVGMLLGASASCFLAFVLTKYIEQPALRAFRNAYKQNRRIQSLAKKLTPGSHG